jgi:CSLREA domain-containing protein
MSVRDRLRGLLLSMVVTFLVLVGASPLFAATITVDTSGDDETNNGNCTLREAIQAANTNTSVDGCAAGGTNDTIDLTGRSGAIILSSPLPAVNDTLTILGPGAAVLTVDANNVGRVLTISSGGVATVNISGITMTGGSALLSGGGILVLGDTLNLSSCVITGNDAANGGGIYVDTGHVSLTGCSVEGNAASSNGGAVFNLAGSVEISDTTVSGNVATSTYGGGIYNQGSMVIDTSTITNNVATGGGGIHTVGSMAVTKSRITGNTTTAGTGFGSGAGIYNGGDLSVSRSTVEGNVTDANGAGGGIYNNFNLTVTESAVTSNQAYYGAGILSQGTMTVTSSTVSGNISTGTDKDGAGILNTACTNCTVSILNSTIVNNIGMGVANWRNEPDSLTLRNAIVADNAVNNCNYLVTSLGHNLDSGDSCGFTVTGDITNTSPLLGPLADNGGLTLTHALLAGSPALDSGDSNVCSLTDQRGVPRPQNGDKKPSSLCDIGAYEYFSKIAVLSPKPAEAVPSGTSYVIEWMAVADMETFHVLVSFDNGTNWSSIAKDVPAKTVTWSVPTPLSNKKACLIKVIGFNSENRRIGSSRTWRPFALEVVHVTEPKGDPGEPALVAGQPLTIRWTTNATRRPVDTGEVLYSTDGGATWKMIVAGPGNPGYFDGTVPDVLSKKKKCKFKVRLKDADGNVVAADATDGWITILPSI